MIKSEFLAKDIKDLSSKTPVLVFDGGYILGWWGESGGYQFLVYPSQDSSTCTVMELLGWDYGGGVGDIFYDVDHSKVEALINGAESWAYTQCKLLNDILNDE